MSELSATEPFEFDIPYPGEGRPADFRLAGVGLGRHLGEKYVSMIRSSTYTEAAARNQDEADNVLLAHAIRDIESNADILREKNYPDKHVRAFVRGVRQGMRELEVED